MVEWILHLASVFKHILRKVLGRTSLDFKDLMTTLCGCEAVINSRPITYLSNDPNDLVPLTPAMFLREQIESSVHDCDQIDGSFFCRNRLHKPQLKEDLRKRFRNKYLGQLKLQKKRKISRPFLLEEVVLIGNDSTKRLD